MLFHSCIKVGIILNTLTSYRFYIEDGVSLYLFICQRGLKGVKLPRNIRKGMTKVKSSQVFVCQNVLILPYGILLTHTKSIFKTSQ